MNLAPIDQSHWSGESVSFDSAPLSLLPRSWEAGNWSGEGGSDACRCLQPRLAPTSRCYREPPRHVPSRAAQRSCKNPSLDFTTTFLHNHSRLLLDTLTLPLLYIWHHLHSQTSFINLFHKPLSQTFFTRQIHRFPSISTPSRPCRNRHHIGILRRLLSLQCPASSRLPSALMLPSSFPQWTFLVTSTTHRRSSSTA